MPLFFRGHLRRRPRHRPRRHRRPGRAGRGEDPLPQHPPAGRARRRPGDGGSGRGRHPVGAGLPDRGSRPPGGGRPAGRPGHGAQGPGHRPPGCGERGSGGYGGRSICASTPPAPRPCSSITRCNAAIATSTPSVSTWRWPSPVSRPREECSWAWSPTRPCSSSFSRTADLRFPDQSGLMASSPGTSIAIVVVSALGTGRRWIRARTETHTMAPLDDVVLSRRGFLGLAAAAAASGALMACGSSSDETTSDTTVPAVATTAAGLANGRTATVRTCVYAKNHASSMLYWQKFAPPGVTVTVVPVTSTAEILQALEGGSLDFGLMSPYVPMLTQAKSGISCRTVVHGGPPGLRSHRQDGRGGVGRRPPGEEDRRPPARRPGARPQQPAGQGRTRARPGPRRGAPRLRRARRPPSPGAMSMRSSAASRRAPRRSSTASACGCRVCSTRPSATSTPPSGRRRRC